MLEAAHKLPWERKTKLDLPDIGATTTVLVITKDARVYAFEGDSWYPLQGEFLAWGSGQDAALGAFHMGATARRAVEIACKVDRNSGPPVNCIKLDDI